MRASPTLRIWLHCSGGETPTFKQDPEGVEFKVKRANDDMDLTNNEALTTVDIAFRNGSSMRKQNCRDGGSGCAFQLHHEQAFRSVTSTWPTS
ncbi:MAG: hypothetical protein H7A16_04630 [Sinobacteraceae bacterium]|nr:hypothetical protein [Nevskiaceae bacterium]